MATDFLSYRAYPLAVFGAVGAASLISIYLAPRRAIRRGDYMVVQLVLATTALLGAKAYGVAEAYLRADTALPIWWAGMRYPGLVAGGLAAVPLARGLLPRGVTLSTMGDIAAPGLAAGMAIVRLGCLAAGCCHGTVSDLPWAVTYPRGSEAWERHLALGLISPGAARSLAVLPLQLYFGVWSALVAVFCLALVRRRLFEGRVFWIYLLTHEIGKAALEPLRDPYAWHLQVASLLLAGSALVILVVWGAHDIEAG